MNAGVSMAPYAVVNRPWRAPESRSLERSSNTRHCAAVSVFRNRSRYRLAKQCRSRVHLKRVPASRVTLLKPFQSFAVLIAAQLFLPSAPLFSQDKEAAGSQAGGNDSSKR